MKRIISLIIVLSLILVSCGRPATIGGVEYETVGFIEMVAPNNVTGDYSKEIQYEVCWGNVIWGVILIETIIAPIYFFGFSMFNPVRKLNRPVSLWIIEKPSYNKC